MSHASGSISAIQELRNQGYAVIIWSPEEFEGKDLRAKDIQDRSIEFSHQMIEQADDNEPKDTGFSLREVEALLDAEEYLQLITLINVAAGLMGDGGGGDLGDNEEYERGQIELICESVGVPPEYRDDVRNVIYHVARAQTPLATT